MCYFFFFFFLMIRRPPRSTLFPTRRSSDLGLRGAGESPLELDRRKIRDRISELKTELAAIEDESKTRRDRKSTRLNSSHLVISYAVFCLKKKKNKSRPENSHVTQSFDSKIR